MLYPFPAGDREAAATTAALQTRFSVDLGDTRQIFVPYRICPLGAHVDHQGGHVLGRPLPGGTLLAYAPLPEPEIHLASVNFPGTICFEVGVAAQPDPLRRRATHFFGEVARVNKGTSAWRAGNLPHFGTLMNESCASSIHQYESGHEAVIALQKIVSGTPGVYGSRFSGGGYGGCVVALVERMHMETAAARIIRRYRKLFPALAEKATIYWVQ